VYDAASDIAFFCPNWRTLAPHERVRAAGELWVATARYESSFRPGIEVIDVGSKDNPDTWSVGLYQVSVIDQTSYEFNSSYTFAELKTPAPNIDLAHRIMMRQLSRRGAIVVPSGPYWAVLYRGKYSKVDEIAAHVRQEVDVCG